MQAKALKLGDRVRQTAKPAVLLVVGLFLLLLSLPLITQNRYLLGVVTFAQIYAILAVSFDVVLGYTGQINLGHAIFFGMGGYTLALLNLHYGVPWWLGLMAGAVAGGLVGVIIGIICLRFARMYLALVTMSLSILIFALGRTLTKVTGGDLGLSGIQKPSASAAINYELSLVIMFLSVTVMYFIVKSRWGLMFQAIRENETAALAAGINTTLYKVLSFTVGAFFAGLAGAFFASYMSLITPDSFYLGWLLNTMYWWGIGGAATLIGPVLGAYFLTFLGEGLHAIGEYRIIIFSIIFIVVIFFLPGGLYKALTLLMGYVKWLKQKYYSKSKI